MNTSIKNTTFNQISCTKSSYSFCVLKSTFSDTVQFINSNLININSNVDIISVSNCAQVLLSNVAAQNILKSTQENFDQIFVLNALNIESLSLDQSEFSQVGFSGIKAKNAHLEIENTNFSNNIETHRLLVQSTDDNSIVNAKLTQIIQFIVLDTSNSTLTSCSFIENSLNSLVDHGGAVHILGLRGIHQITDCVFENNQAANGAALSVKGHATSIHIINSQFINNQVTGNGGALIFADKSVKNDLLISQTTFLQNVATFGGAIYLGNQPLIVDSSTFIENNALKGGGALATMSPSKTTSIDLRQSTFKRNSATEGAALIALKEMNFIYSTSSFQENTAVYGGDLTSIPTSIRLRIYYFDSYFLFIQGITVKDLLSSPTTTLIYDSATASGSELVAFTSGSYPNLLFEVTILDAFGNKMGQTVDAQGAFKISSYNSSSSLVGLLGSTSFTYSNSLAQIFNAFSVKGPFETTVTLSIEGTYISQSTNSVQPLPSLKFSIILGKCSIGQIYEKSSAICSSCSVRTYSLADPFSAQSCQECLDHAICLGGSMMYPAQGYWRSDGASENLIKCPQSDSCLGGSKDGGKNISLTGFCLEGYEGVACSSCSPGYAKFGSNQSCVDCKSTKLYYIMFGGYLLLQALAVIFSVRINLMGSKVNKASHQNSVLQSTLMKIVIDFVQILTLASEFNFNFPPVVNYLYDGVSKIIPTNVDALSVDCFISLEKGSNKHVFFYKVLVILAEPFAYMIFAYIAWVIIFRIKKRVISENPDFKSKMYLTTIVIIYILQPGIIKIMFELFNCKNYGSLADPKYYLVYDVDVQCWKPAHLLWGLCIAIPTIIFGFIAPFGILVFWTRDKSLKAAEKVQKHYTFIFKSYQNNALFWEIAILTRKVLLIIISVFITSQYLQAYLGFLLLAMYFHISYKISPYNNPQLNMAEAISLASSAFILYSGLYFARSDEMDTVSYMLFVCDMMSGLIFVLYSLYVFFRIFKKTAADLGRKLSKIGSKILSDKIYNNLKSQIQSHEQQQQQTLAPPLMSPLSLRFDEPVDTPTSSRRIMLSDRMTSSERIMSTDRPLSPLIRILRPEFINEDDTGTERRGNSFTELPVFSPINMTGAELLSLNIRQRGSSIPVNWNANDSPGEAEDLDFQEFLEVLEHESVNSPPASVDNKTSKVLKFSKENWTEAVSKKNSEKIEN